MHTHTSPETAPPPVPWGWSEIGAIIALVMVYLAGITLLRFLGIFTWMNVQPGLSSPIVYITSTGLFVVVLAGIFMLVARPHGWHVLGVRRAPWWAFALVPPLFVAELFGVIIINAIIIMMTGSFENPQVETITGGQTLEPMAFVRLFVLVAVIGPIVEELFFRGMLYPLMRHRWGSSLAIVASAAFFSAIHMIPVLFFALFFVGLVLALLREWSGSTLPCMALHMMQNGFMIVLLYLAPSFTG